MKLFNTLISLKTMNDPSKAFEFYFDQLKNLLIIIIRPSSIDTSTAGKDRRVFDDFSSRIMFESGERQQFETGRS
jgi:hypothetical protein